MPTEADVDLLARLRGRDSAARRAAEHEVFERYSAGVDRLLRRMLGHDTEDCLQEVFVDVYRGLSGFEGDARLSTWIYRIALRRAWKCAARRKRDEREGDEPERVTLALARDDEGDTEAAVEGQELAQRFAQALQRLEIEQRTVLALTAIDGLSPSEMADVLGLPVGTVHSRLARARVRMRELLSLDA